MKQTLLTYLKNNHLELFNFVKNISSAIPNDIGAASLNLRKSLEYIVNHIINKKQNQTLIDCIDELRTIKIAKELIGSMHSIRIITNKGIHYGQEIPSLKQINQAFEELYYKMVFKLS